MRAPLIIISSLEAHSKLIRADHRSECAEVQQFRIIYEPMGDYWGAHRSQVLVAHCRETRSALVLIGDVDVYIVHTARART